MSQQLTEIEKLKLCDSKTPKWSFNGQSVSAKCVKVYDGDTATFVFFPHAHSNPHKFSCRCLGYNSAEIKTSNPDEKKKAIAARDYLASRILNEIVVLRLGAFDKYGRILVDIYLNNVHINQEMLFLGFGKPYDGRGEKCF